MVKQSTHSYDQVKLITTKQSMYSYVKAKKEGLSQTKIISLVLLIDPKTRRYIIKHPKFIKATADKGTFF